MSLENNPQDDRLAKLFQMQAALNNKTFAKNGILSVEDGSPLTAENLIRKGMREIQGPNTDTNEWLKKYLWALQAEGDELKEELLEKWWSKDKLDMQNIRVEIIDILHFWICLAQAAGMTADDVFSIYEQKNLVNLNRQDQGYSKATKDESDNKSIQA